MLAWLHQAVASEKELLDALFDPSQSEEDEGRLCSIPLRRGGGGGGGGGGGEGCRKTH